MENKRGKRLIISVIGAGEPDPVIAGLAEEVGRELAKRGATVVCGGLGGVMEAACRGAKSAGGTTIGILPGHDPAAANRWVDIPVCTGLGYAQNVIVVRTGRAVIAVGGAYGTLADGIPVGCPQDLDHRPKRARGRRADPRRGPGRRRGEGPGGGRATRLRRRGLIDRPRPATGLCTRKRLATPDRPSTSSGRTVLQPTFVVSLSNHRPYRDFWWKAHRGHRQ